MYRWTARVLVMLGTVAGSQPWAAAQDLDASGEPVAQAAPEEVSPLAVEPKSPLALFDAIVLMLDLDRPNLAKRYLSDLMAQDLQDADILAIRDKHGPGTFLQLSNDPRLQPQSIELLDLMNDTFRRFAADTNRLDRLVNDLAGPAERREPAIIQLRNTGIVVVPRILNLIQTQQDPSLKDAIIYALARMGRQIVPALHGALESPSEIVQTTAIESLGWLGERDSAAWLWHPAFGPASSQGVRDSARVALARIIWRDPKRVADLTAYGAVRQLEDLARTHFRYEFPWSLDDQNQTQLWAWDRAGDVLTAWNVAPETASLIVGSRFARQALAMSPERQDLQALYLSLRLTFDAHMAGWSAPLPTGPGTTHDLALLAGPDVALEMLAHALKNPNPQAALAALQVLGQVGHRSQLAPRNGQSSPILQALDYPSTRVQFAAAVTVLQFDPEEPFRGASRVVDVLHRSLKDSGSRTGLAIDPNVDRAATFSGLLADMGYQPEVATTPQNGFQIASSRADIAVIAIHAAIDGWGLRQTVANLRADARTAGIPIVIYGPENVQLDADHVIDRYPLVAFALEGENSFKVQARQFLNRLETPADTDSQRNARIEAAGFWFAHIADGRRTRVFDIRPAEGALYEAVNHPAVGVNAIVAMGGIPSASAQQALQEIAVASVRDAALREAAALQLAFHIQRYGLLLDEARVQEVTGSFDAATDPALRTALSSVIGSFRPRTSRVTELLETLPDPALPAVQP